MCAHIKYQWLIILATTSINRLLFFNVTSWLEFTSSIGFELDISTYSWQLFLTLTSNSISQLTFSTLLTSVRDELGLCSYSSIRTKPLTPDVLGHFFYSIWPKPWVYFPFYHPIVTKYIFYVISCFSLLKGLLPPKITNTR